MGHHHGHHDGHHGHHGHHKHHGHGHHGRHGHHSFGAGPHGSFGHHERCNKDHFNHHKRHHGHHGHHRRFDGSLGFEGFEGQHVGRCGHHHRRCGVPATQTPGAQNPPQTTPETAIVPQMEQLTIRPSSAPPSPGCHSPTAA